jgi:hypothetical protein
MRTPGARLACGLTSQRSTGVSGQPPRSSRHAPGPDENSPGSPLETIADLAGHKAEGYLQFARRGQSRRSRGLVRYVVAALV